LLTFIFRFYGDEKLEEARGTSSPNLVESDHIRPDPPEPWSGEGHRIETVLRQDVETATLRHGARLWWWWWL